MNICIHAHLLLHTKKKKQKNTSVKKNNFKGIYVLSKVAKTWQNARVSFNLFRDEKNILFDIYEKKIQPSPWRLPFNINLFKFHSSTILSLKRLRCLLMFTVTLDPPICLNFHCKFKGKKYFIYIVTRKRLFYFITN